MDKLSKLRQKMLEQSVGAYLVPSQDEYLSEYPPECFKRLQWLTGFTGSAGIAVALEDKAAFFTDGRYTLQASEQVSSDYEQYNISDKTPAEWLEENLPTGKVLGYDAWLHTKKGLDAYKRKNISLQSIPNLVDKSWEDKPIFPTEKAFVHDVEYSGQASDKKRKKVICALEVKQVDALVITASDSLCWLLNIRGYDVNYTPLLLGYGIVHTDGHITLYLNPEKIDESVSDHLGTDVHVYPVDMLTEELKHYAGQRVLIDPENGNSWFFEQLEEVGAQIVEGADPCQLLKACKNNVEVEGMRQAHIRDGVALTEFLYWLEQEVPKGNVSEYSAQEKLSLLRAEQELFHDLSFDVISGFAANGAIVHYRVTEESNQPLSEGQLYLVDSGGQYLDGTTDVTRTVALGGNPTQEQKEHFTRVLKGHIAIATAQFPEGTRGCDLDVLARKALWQAGLDYDHGTGHGVGSFLGVHEGPQGISKRAETELKPGMILSNEPGYYKTGAYGIRIENLIVVVEKDQGETKRFLGVETLTKAPIDLSLIELSLLTTEEKTWLNQYHKEVKESLSSHLDDISKAWLKDKTASI